MIEYNRWIDSYLSWIWNVFEYIKGCIEIHDNNRCTKIYIWNIHLDTIVEVICFSKACVLIRISIWNTFESVLGLAIGRYVRYTGIWDEQSEKAMHCVLVQCLAFGSSCIAIESHVMHGWLRGWSWSWQKEVRTLIIRTHAPNSDMFWRRLFWSLSMGDVSVMNAHEQNLLMEGYVDVRFDAIFDVTESLRATDRKSVV